MSELKIKNLHEKKKYLHFINIEINYQKYLHDKNNINKKHEY